ncbi:MAG: PAS domain S-box protein [bacterium]|nr:PAS domain S-box protein [bacterium]
MTKERIHVLLVEDEEAHAELIRRAFEPQEGLIRLTVARSLAEAHACLTESLPDLAIVDLFLPDGRGIELLSEEDEPRYPVVVITSHGDEEVAVEAMKAGALQYLVKSEASLADIPHKVEMALRQWGHIIERRQAEEALQASEAHFRSLIENAQDVITVLNEDGTIHYASPAIERVLGYRPDERVGVNMCELIHPEDREDFARKLEQAFRGPGPTPAVVYRDQHRDGSWRIFEGIGSSHPQRDGQRRAVINSRDITQRRQVEEAKKQLEERLRRAQRREVIGALAGDIANEFYNLLTPILESSTMALQYASPGSKVRAGLKKVLGAVTRSRDLAEQILIFSRQGEPQRKAVELPMIVHEVVELLRDSLPETIEIRQTIDPECEAVSVDPVQIHQVLMNLCRNAEQAMRERGGTLEIRLSMVEVDAELVDTLPSLREGTYARLIVADTGHGMDRVTGERALDPFFTTRDKGEGTGLGLPLAQGIAVSHGGELVIDSEPGKGTTVQVYLPHGAS